MKFNLLALAALIGQVALIAPAMGAPVEEVAGLVAVRIIFFLIIGSGTYSRCLCLIRELLNRQAVGHPLAATRGSGGARKDLDSAGLGSGGVTASRPAAGLGSGGATGVVEMLSKRRNCTVELLMK